MFSKVIATILLLDSLLLGCLSIDRDQIKDEYTPILLEHSTNLTAIYEKSTLESNVVMDQLINNTRNMITLLNSQITLLKSTIVNAQNLSVGKTAVLNCLKTQSTAATKITTNSVNATCWTDDAFEPLTTVEGYYQALSKVPNATLAACGQLDPLPTQDDLFLDCITGKILDLDDQIRNLEATFDNAKSTIMQTFLVCLGNESAAIAQQINEVNIEVTLCLALT